MTKEDFLVLIKEAAYDMTVEEGLEKLGGLGYLHKGLKMIGRTPQMLKKMRSIGGGSLGDYYKHLVASRGGHGRALGVLGKTIAPMAAATGAIGGAGYGLYRGGRAVLGGGRSPYGR